MIKRALVLLALVAGLPVAGAATAPCAYAQAKGVHHAGLVVQLADDDIRRYCVGFDEESISGLELLRRSGVPLTVQDFGADGVMVCRIAGVGCRYPSQPCTCEYTTTGRFWGYYTIEGTRWRFSQQGAAADRVRDGDVEGWRWSRHGVDGASPPSVAGAQACAAGTIAAGLTAKAPARGSPMGVVLVSLVLGVASAGAWARTRARRRAVPE